MIFKIPSNADLNAIEYRDRVVGMWREDTWDFYCICCDDNMYDRYSVEVHLLKHYLSGELDEKIRTNVK